MEDLSQKKRVAPDCDDVVDIPSEKTSEIKPTEIEDANGTIDDSLQGRQVVPDCDDMQMDFEIKPTGIEDAKVLNGTMDDSLQGRLVTPNCDDMTDFQTEKTSKIKPSGIELTDTMAQKKGRVVTDCETPTTLPRSTKTSKAIEDEDTPTLKQAIKELKTAGGGSGVLLDICRLIKKSGVAYSMSLLALCGFHGREEMVDLLLKEGADMNAECACVKHTGTPILQMMLHCLIQDNRDKLSSTMLEHFIQKGASLSGKIATRHFGLYHNDSGGLNYGMLDLPLSMKKIDCAKELVKAGVDLINGGCPRGEKFDVVPMFQEYRDHGTNKFIRWAFNEYNPNLPEVDLGRIIQSLVNMKKKDKKSCLWQSVRRTPAHAILICRHRKTVDRLVECGKEHFDGLDLLAEQSCTDKTALHVAAENGDVNGADTRVSDKFGMNPFMIAVEKGHLGVVKAMMRKDPGLVSLSICFGSTVIHWALQKGHQRSAFFKGCFEENPKALLTPDSQGNTIAHLVAASGNNEVFEILWSEEFAMAIYSAQNADEKTPLQLAVEKGHVNILKTFQSLVDGQRQATAPQWHRELMTKWPDKVVTLFLHASSCGSLGAVKYFIDNGQKPNLSHNGKTLLLCAAEAGHDEIVAYLLTFEKVRTDLKNQPEKVASASESPLLMAAQNGHTKCVTLLLQNGGNVYQRDYRDRNCLTIAILNQNRATALAILYEKDGLKALERNLNLTPLQQLLGNNEEALNAQQVLEFVKRFPFPQRQSSIMNKTPTPLQLLIKEMPDLAEYALNKCVTHAEPKRQISTDGEDSVDTPDQPDHYNFDLLEDQISDECNDDHILAWMIEHQSKFLWHPLVESFIFHKFWTMTFPLLLLNLLFYFILLVALNVFALAVPRPGPNSDTCPENNGTSSECQGQSEVHRGFLAAAAIALYTLSLIGILMEVLQLERKGWKYFRNPDIYFQFAFYALMIVFILGFDNECWCSGPFQWQIGAFAVFFSWLNFIFALKYIPKAAVPINMFLTICVEFLKLIFLPFVLLLAFGIPFYMVFVKEVGNLTAFRSPYHAVAKTLLQLAGEFDFEATFNEGTLLYTQTTYILFIIFLITMPILFTNLLTGLAVGDIQKERERAELTRLKLWVELILEQQRMKEWPKIWFIYHLLKVKDNTDYAEIVKELKTKNEEIYNTVMAQNFEPEVKTPNPADSVKAEDITALKEDISNFRKEMMAHIKPVGAREDITKLKEDISSLKQQMAKLVQALTSKNEAAAFNH